MRLPVEIAATRAGDEASTYLVIVKSLKVAFPAPAPAPPAWTTEGAVAPKTKRAHRFRWRGLGQETHLGYRQS